MEPYTKFEIQGPKVRCSGAKNMLFQIYSKSTLFLKQEGHDGPGSLTWHNRIQAMS
jgi:hypothetical protein